MNPMEHRVAWAWLDKAMGRARLPSAPNVPAKSDKEKAELIERAYEDLKASLTAAIAAEISGIQRAEEMVAHRAGIDPVFLDWFLINGKHWPTLPDLLRRSLRAVQSIFIWFGALPDHWNNMAIPDLDGGDARDVAMQELGTYFAKTALPRIEKKFANAIWKKSRELTDVFRGPGATPDPKASILLMHDFKRRLVADRFQKKPAIQQIADMLI